VDLYRIFQHFGSKATQIASVWAVNAADALGVVAGHNARIVSCRWVRYPETMVSSVRERTETANGPIFTVRILQARKWDPTTEEGRAPCDTPQP
jgi:hypothetical protein